MLETMTPNRFQILALSGGGFRGLYTAKVLADIEDEIREPIARHFDLIAGTSVGGILALAIAMEIPASRIVDLFVKHGEQIFKRRLSLRGIWRAPFSLAPLQNLLSADNLFGKHLLGQCKHPVIIPSNEEPRCKQRGIKSELGEIFRRKRRGIRPEEINYSTGKPVIFKTPHHPDFKRDHQHHIVDIALATSAAPGYFPRHTFNNNQYVDGGLYANAPGLLAIHEAQTFFQQDDQQIHLLSVGTMSSKFTVDPRRNREGGTLDWGGVNPANMPKRLFGLSISVQESLSKCMLEHRLHERYLYVDDDLTDQRAQAVALDKTDSAAQEVLMGAATERSKICIGNTLCQSFLRHSPRGPIFFYGENTTCKETSC